MLGRQARPVNFVVSLRLGEPPSLDPIRERLAIAPGLQFKLDATSSWDEALIAELRATGAVASIDFKGAYHGTVVDQPPDPVLYRRVAEGLPGVWLEDPALIPEIDTLLEPYRDQITWDALITSVADVEALPFPPRTVNVKPSRFGTLEALFATYDYLDEHGIGGYGGGQFELGPGPRSDPGAGVGVPPRRRQRHRSRRLQRSRIQSPACRPARSPAAWSIPASAGSPETLYAGGDQRGRAERAAAPRGARSTRRPAGRTRSAPAACGWT